MTGRRLRALPWAGVVLVSLGLVAGFALQEPAPAQTLAVIPSHLSVPVGATVLDTSGEPVRVLERTPMGRTETLRLPIVPPGQYVVASPAAGLAGDNAPRASSLTLVAATSVTETPKAPGPRYVWLLLLAMGLAAASALVTRTAASLTLAGLGLAALAGYGMLGLAGVATAALVVGVLLLSGVAMVLCFLPRPTSVAARLAGAVAGGAVALGAAGLNVPVSAAALGAAALALAALSRSGRLRTVLGVAAGVCGALALTVTVGSLVPASLPGGPPARPDQCMAVATSPAGPHSGEYTDCWRAVGASLARLRDWTDANEQLTSTLEQISRTTGTGPACRMAGDSIGITMAMRHAADARGLVDQIDSPCDFSGLHGWAIGALARVPVADLPEAAARLCVLPGPAGMPDATFTTQCWHGVGQAVARHTGFDLAVLAQVCAQVPRESGDGPYANCGEGFFAEAADDVRHALHSPAGGHLPGGMTLSSICAEVDLTLADGCYRYVDVDFLSPTGVDNESEAVAEGMTSLCRGLAGDPHEPLCWWGMGSALTNNPPTPERDPMVAFIVSWCDKAPDLSMADTCKSRGLSNVVSSEASRGSDFDAGPLCRFFTGPTRDQLCTALVTMPTTLSGQSAHHRAGS